MPRIRLEMPEHFTFSTELPVRISDINYGGHLSNDAVLSLLHEARVRYLATLNYSEMDIEGAGIIMTDTAIVYKNESFHGDLLQIDVTATDFNRYGCDIYYLISNRNTAVEVAHAKTGISFIDYQTRKLVSVPDAFRDRVMKEPR